MATIKKFTYHKSHSFVDVKTGETITFATQLYQVGVYGIVNNNSAMQGSYEPKLIVKAEKNFKKLQEQGIIKDLTFGTPITVSEVNGFWEEVK